MVAGNLSDVPRNGVQGVSMRADCERGPDRPALRWLDRGDSV